MNCTFSIRCRWVLTAVCAVGLFASCSSVPNVFCDNTTIIPKFGKEITLKGELLSDSVWLVSNIFARDGLMVAIQDRNAEYIFRVITPQGQTLGQFGTRGRADNEFINTFFFEQYYHTPKSELVLWIGDLSKNKLIALNVNQSLARKQVVADRVIETPTAASLASFVLNDSLICMLDFVDDNFTMIYRETPTDFVRAEVDFFQKTISKDRAQLYIGTGWNITPDRKNLINVMGAINQINKYSISDQSRKTVSVYNAPEAEPEKTVDPDGLPLMTYYKKVISDVRYIYALYAGVAYAEDTNPKHCSEIHVFDHDLNPVRVIRVDKNVYQITIDPSVATLYGLGYDGLIWKFPLPADL